MIKFNLIRQNLTADYNRNRKIKNYLTYIKFHQRELKIFIYKLFTIVFFMWTMLIHLLNANKYYQIAIFGVALWLYLTFKDEIHRK